MTSSVPLLPPAGPEQAAALAGWSGCAQLVLGGPGSGKTTLVATAAVERLRADGPAPLVLAATRSQASRLRNQVAAELGAGSWQPAVTTVHALARTLWQRFGERPELRLLAAPEQEFRVRELLSGGPSARWPEHLAHAVRTRGFAAQVRTAIARARQLGLEPEDLVTFGEADQRPEWVGVGQFFAEYLDVLDAEGVLDYAELVHRVRLLLTDAPVREVLATEIGAVLIDDITELDAAQVALIAAVAGGAQVLATADPDSVASGFRGADPRAIADFEQHFATPERPARLVQLTGSYRFGPGIGAALAGVQARLPRPAGVGVASGESAIVNPEQVRVLTCAAEAEQAAAIIAEVQSARLAEGIDYAEMAILVRSGRRQLAALQRQLVTAGIPVEIAGDEIALAESPTVQPLLLGLAASIREQIGPDQAVPLLTSPLGGIDVLGLRRLARLWRRDHPEAAGSSLPVQLADALNDPAWAQADGDPNLQRLRSLQQLLSEARAAVAAGQPVDEVAWTLWSGTTWPQRLRAESLSGGSAATRADADLDAACAFFEQAALASRDGGAKGVRNFLAELSAQQIPADREREGRVRRSGVQIVTPHRARGREWDLVIVAGVQEGQWPSGRRHSSVLDANQLTVAGLGGRSDYRELLAAERRLFHLACSRARRRVVVTATAGTEGEGDAPSRFLAELGVGALPPTADRLPLTLPSLAARLRRVATDADQPAALRDAAAVELARLGQGVDADGRALVPAADPTTWWGVRPLSSEPTPSADAALRLSPSQVASVLTCPRRYFVGRNAATEAGPGLPAALGSLTHLLVQRVFTEDLDVAELQSALDGVWDRLPFGARWLSASERAEVEASLARFLAWREARAAEPVGVELPFSLELPAGGHVVRLEGKVDWLERTDAGLRVVDFKTARSAPTKAEVAGMDQLGIYQLAIESGGFAEHGIHSVGAAAVYLRQGGRSDEQPKEFEQPSLASVPYLDNDPSERDFPTWVHQRIAAAAAVVAEGRFPATPGAHCRACPFAGSCPASGSGEQVAP